MKLNPDCIRDLLLHLENSLSVSQGEDNVFSFDPLTIAEISQSLPSYPAAELVNTIMTLEDGGFITAYADYCGTGIAELEVAQITYSGYQFIEKIRPDTVWGKIKKACIHAGSFSLDLISAAGSEILISLATSYLNL